MFYVNRIRLFFACIFVWFSILVMCSCQTKRCCFDKKKIESKNMSLKDQKINKELGSSVWLEDVKKEFSLKNSGSFLAKDKFGKQVIVDWKKTDMISADYVATMSSFWSIACQAYTKIEMEFLKAHPEFVGSDMFFKPFEPFFKNGFELVDWQLVQDKMQEVLKGFFVFDPTSWGDEIKNKLSNVVHIFVFVSDKETGKKLGFITFLINYEYAQGDVKCTTFAVLPEEQNRGLGKLLMSSVLKILPQVERIFLCTRITNKFAQKVYLNWGFGKEENPVVEEHNYTFNLNHWIFFEYEINESNNLQKIANGFVDNK